MAAPSTTENSANNVIASGSLAASGTTTVEVNLTSKFAGQFQAKNTGGGTVAGTNGLRVQVFRMFTGTSGVVDTNAILDFTIATTVSTTAYQSFEISTGRYQIKFTNLDASNAITAGLTSTTIDAVA